MLAQSCLQYGRPAKLSKPLRPSFAYRPTPFDYLSSIESDGGSLAGKVLASASSSSCSRRRISSFSTLLLPRGCIDLCRMLHCVRKINAGRPIVRTAAKAQPSSLSRLVRICAEVVVCIDASFLELPYGLCTAGEDAGVMKGVDLNRRVCGASAV